MPESMTRSDAGHRSTKWLGLLRPSAGQSRWALADQILSSGTNFGVAIVLARSLGPDEFGVFALAFVTWVGAMSLARALLAHPYVIRAAPLAGDEWRTETRLAAGSILGLSSLAGAATVGIGLGQGVDSSLGRTLLALGVFVPPLMLQDFWRLAGFSSDRARSAFVNDAVWAVVETVLLASLWASGKLSAPTATIAWGIGSLAGALVGARQFHSIPIFGLRALRWIRANLPFGGWFGLSSAIYTAGSQVAVIILGVALGPAAVGGIRAVQNLFGPVQLLSIAGESVALPASARMSAQHGLAGVRQFISQYIVMLGLIVTSYAAAFVVFSETLLRLVFGESFAAYAPLALPLSLSYVAGIWGSGASIGLRATRAGRGLVIAQVIGTLAKLALVALLVSPFGLVGGAWALCIGAVAHSGALWGKFLTGTRDESPGSDGRPAVPLPFRRRSIKG
jgi:O-antigen/teichoic acid export membrane protein